MIDGLDLSTTSLSSVLAGLKAKARGDRLALVGMDGKYDPAALTDHDVTRLVAAERKRQRRRLRNRRNDR